MSFLCTSGGQDVNTFKEQLSHEAAGYEIQLQERFRALEMQHEDNLRKQRERMQEEIVRTQEDCEGRARERIAQLEREKAAYEKRLRDKYADMVKELEDRSK